MTVPLRNTRTCFFENAPSYSLVRRASAEAVGTFLVMLVATSSGLQVQRLFPTMPALGLVINAAALAGALVSLILAFGAVSGGHLNPLITGLQWLGRERALSCAASEILAQSGGAVGGALVARALFAATPEVQHSLDTWSMAFSEFVASAGPMAVVFGCARSRRAETGPFAVGLWLGGAIVAMPSTSYANPAIALAAVFATGPIALDLRFVAMEILGAVISYGVIGYVFSASAKPDVGLRYDPTTRAPDGR